MIEENKKIAKRFFEEINKGNLDVIDDLFSQHFLDRSPGPDSPTKIPGYLGIKRYFEEYLKSFDNLRFTINDMVAENDKVVSYVTARAINTGAYMGFSPSNKETEVTWVIMFKILDGKIVESWDISDEGTLLKHIGVRFVKE